MDGGMYSRNILVKFPTSDVYEFSDWKGKQSNYFNGCFKKIKCQKKTPNVKDPSSHNYRTRKGCYKVGGEREKEREEEGGGEGEREGDEEVIYKISGILIVQLTSFNNNLEARWQQNQWLQNSEIKFTFNSFYC